MNARSKRCAQVGCTKQPNYGAAGTNKNEFCAEHKIEGMVKNVMDKSCDHHAGCTKIPVFGVASTNKREFCSKHAGQGMVNPKQSTSRRLSGDTGGNGRLAREGSAIGDADATRRAGVGEKREHPCSPSARSRRLPRAISGKAPSGSARFPPACLPHRTPLKNEMRASPRRGMAQNQTLPLP